MHPGFLSPSTQGHMHLDAVPDLSDLTMLSGRPVTSSEETQSYVCGSFAFEMAISYSLDKLGVLSTSIHKETFAY